MIAAQERASQIEGAIKASVLNIRMEWVTLAHGLHEFHAMKGWAVLGYETLEEWLAAPEIELSRSRVFALIAAYQEYVIERKVPEVKLGRVDMTKAEEVLPAVRRGQVSWQQALSDAEVLGFRDLRERYLPSGGPENGKGEAWHWERCPSCGSKIKVKDASAAKRSKAK